MNRTLTAAALAALLSTSAPAHAGIWKELRDAVLRPFQKKNAPVKQQPKVTNTKSVKPTLVVSGEKPLVRGEKPVVSVRFRPPEEKMSPRIEVAIQHTSRHNELLELPSEDFSESNAYGYRGGTRDLHVTLPAAQLGGKVTKLVWFHGAGQTPNNIIIRRLSRAFAAKGLAVEIHSMEYEAGVDHIMQFLDEQKEPVLIGGHSAGTALADHIASRGHANVKGAILLNGARGDHAVVPTLQLRGVVTDGEALSSNPKVTLVSIKNGDHSLRYHAPDGSESRNKDDQNRSVGTWEMNLLVADHVKKFVEAL